MVGDKNNKTKKNLVEIEAYLKPSWVLASTKRQNQSLPTIKPELETKTKIEIKPKP
jgi:hypothetical protein